MVEIIDIEDNSGKIWEWRFDLEYIFSHFMLGSKDRYFQTRQIHYVRAGKILWCDLYPIPEEVKAYITRQLKLIAFL